ncbi:hypothetical protein D3C78_1187070 [compost metagenome]
MLKVGQVQWLPEQAWEGTGEGQGQVGPCQFDCFDKAFDNDDVQRHALFWGLSQVGSAGWVAGLYITLGDGFEQPIDVGDAHAGRRERTEGGRQCRARKPVHARHAHAIDCPAAIIVRSLGSAVGRFSRGGDAPPALQPLLLLQLPQPMLLIAQLLAGRVVGQHVGNGQHA